MDPYAPADSPLPSSLKGALDRCEEITAKGRNNLHEAARLLGDGHRYRFFLASYAAMRVLDDAVDEEFLGSTEERREASRDEMVALIAHWLGQVEAAAAGAFVPSDSSFHPEVFELLQFYLSRSDLGSGPFERLAASLSRDVQELSLQSWEDFFQYCEGASVAPGSVFIYLLACRVDREGHTELDLPEDLDHYARDMAIFCYLTHILRDLPDDAERATQLLTVPTELLESHGFDRESFRSAVRAGEQRVENVLKSLRSRGEGHALACEKRIAELAPHLETQALEILRYLYGMYRRTFLELCAQGSRATA